MFSDYRCCKWQGRMAAMGVYDWQPTVTPLPQWQPTTLYPTTSARVPPLAERIEFVENIDLNA